MWDKNDWHQFFVTKQALAEKASSATGLSERGAACAACSGL